jgi:hypothetical protein
MHGEEYPPFLATRGIVVSIVYMFPFAFYKIRDKTIGN